MYLDTAVAQFFACLRAKGRTRSTVSAYLAPLARMRRHLAETFGVTEIEAVSRRHLDSWVAAEQQRRLAPTGKPVCATTVAHAKDAVKSLFAWAQGEHLVAANPARHLITLRAERVPQVPRNRLSDEQLEALEAAATCPRDAVLVRTLRRTGLRIGSAVTMRVRQVDLKRRNIHVRIGKPARDLTLPIPADLARTLQRHINRLQLGGEDYLFPSRQGAHLSSRRAAALVKAMVVQANRELPRAVRIPEAATIHWLRYTYARTAADSGVPIEVIADLLGHKDIDTTKRIYLGGVNPERMRAAVETMFGDDAPADRSRGKKTSVA